MVTATPNEQCSQHRRSFVADVTDAVNATTFDIDDVNLKFARNTLTRFAAFPTVF